MLRSEQLGELVSTFDGNKVQERLCRDGCNYSQRACSTILSRAEVRYKDAPSTCAHHIMLKSSI